MCEPVPHAQVAAALNVPVERVAHRIPAVVMLVDDDGQDFARGAIYLVLIVLGLKGHVFAARMNNDPAEAANVCNPVLDTTVPFLGRRGIEPKAAQEADRLWTCSIALDGPALNVWYLLVEAFKLTLAFLYIAHEVDACTKRLVLDVKTVLVDEAADDCARVLCKPKVLTKEQPRRLFPQVVWKLLNDNFARKDDFVADLVQLPKPYPIVVGLCLLALLVVGSTFDGTKRLLSFLLELPAHVGIAVEIDLYHMGVVVADNNEAVIDRVVPVLRVEANDDLAALLPDSWANRLQRELGKRLSFFKPADIDVLRRFDLTDGIVQAFVNHFAAGVTAYGAGGGPEKPVVSQAFDGANEDTMHTVGDCVLVFAPAKHQDLFLSHTANNVLRNAPRLTAAPAAVEDDVLLVLLVEQAVERVSRIVKWALMRRYYVLRPVQADLPHMCRHCLHRLSPLVLL